MKDDYIWNGFLRLAYMSVLDYGLAACIHFKYFTFHKMSIYRYISLSAAFLTIIAIVVTPPLLYFLLRRIKNKAKEFKVQFQFGGLYEEFKEEGVMIYSVLMFYIRRIIALIGLVFFNKYVYVQTYLFAASTLANLIWNVSLLPYKKPLDNALNIGSDFILLLAHILYSFMIDDSITEKQLALYGKIIYYILQCSTWILLIGMIVTLVNGIRSLAERCKNRRKQNYKVHNGNEVKVQNFMDDTRAELSIIEPSQTFKVEVVPTKNRYLRRIRKVVKVK